MKKLLTALIAAIILFAASGCKFAIKIGELEIDGKKIEGVETEIDTGGN